MSYLRLFIELRNEDTGGACGRVRVELQDQPGRVDGKVRCSLMGLKAGQLYEMALVCEQGGHYKEYPVGQFGVNPRGQAGPMFRGSFPDETDAIPVTEFKAVIARCTGGSRLVGFRFEPMLIPWQYEEPPMVEEENVHVKEEEPEVVTYTSSCEEPENVAYTSSCEESENVAYTSSCEEPENVAYTEISEEKVILSEMVSEPDEVEVASAAVVESKNAAFVVTAEAAFFPDAIFVLRDLNQVDLVCGDAGRRAFQRYRHLVLAQQNQENYVGIPCRFRPTQHMELAEEGYTLFYTPHGDEPGYGEFGYWMKKL